MQWPHPFFTCVVLTGEDTTRATSRHAIDDHWKLVPDVVQEVMGKAAWQRAVQHLERENVCSRA